MFSIVSVYHSVPRVVVPCNIHHCTGNSATPQPLTWTPPLYWNSPTLSYLLATSGSQDWRPVQTSSYMRTPPSIQIECFLVGENYYRPQRSWGKAMFLHVSVILFTGEWGVCSIACWDTSPHGTRGRHPLGPGTPQSRHPHDKAPPGTRHPPGAGTLHPPQDQAPPLEQALPPSAVHAGIYGQHASGMHPTGMQSCYSSFFQNEEIFVQLDELDKSDRITQA